ncbi:amidohydrolase [Patiriisocius marinus]|uniref:amidohydrolase n=1 Tax=Patiriisocius marinus TaxID=1397112 RepID=UPI00232BB987|nr:amidohydrolase [Patiriisocius marinus]
MKLSHTIYSLLLLVSFTMVAQQTPAPKQQGKITIKNATAHVGNGTVINNATIVINNGKIESIGQMDATAGIVIDATGKHVYPGFIAPTKSLGLIEVEAVRASDDQDEIGDMLPNIRSLIAYNAESKVVESMRPNGVLIGQIAPQGGTISGTSSIVQFDAWNWEDAAIKVDDGIHLHWPNTFRRGRWWAGEPRGFQPNKKYTENVSDITSYIATAKAFGSGKNLATNEAMKAMQGVFNGSKKVYVYADGEKEITDAITQLKESGIKEIVLVGGYEAYKVTPFLKRNNIMVLVQHTHNLPNKHDDDYDLPYKLPILLVDAGLTVALQNSDASNFQTRNLPFYAGQLVGQGVDKEVALQLITGNSAKILGIDNMYGTLEAGKSATLFISEGDALDMRGNILSKAFIDGRDVSLETHQTELWKRYMDKYEGDKK